MRLQTLTTILLAVAALTGLAAAQFSQTLPQGFDVVAGGTSTTQPFTQGSDQKWQWHYDSSEFQDQRPLLITEVSVRFNGGTGSTYNYTDVTVTLIEASTDHMVGSHDPVFDGNIERKGVVRSGPFSGSLPVGNGFEPFGLTTPFIYDPSTGNDFIVQLEICGVNSSFGVSIDGVIGSAGTVGGNRYGHTSSCSATSQSFQNNEYAPVVKIDYEFISQTLPAGRDSIQGGSGTSFPFNTSSEQKWQWHYDASEFEVQETITITELYVRAQGSASTIQAFDYDDLTITMIEASTDYRAVNHDTTFANNVFREVVVRSGPFVGGPVPPAGAPPATWVPLQLQEPFLFDASSGRDLIIQLQTCGVNSTFGTPIDAVGVGAPGTLGGNRYGHTTSCTSATESFRNDEFVPVVRIDFKRGIGFESPIVANRYVQDFDGAVSGSSGSPDRWFNKRDENLGGSGADWSYLSGSTSSSNTGPDDDHTTPSAPTSTYAYVEDSGGEHPAVSLISPVFDFTGVPNLELSFRAHSRNADGAGASTENTLRVLLLREGVPSPFLAVVGHVGNVWEKVVANLAPFNTGPFRLEFRVDSTNGTFTHDIGIDDIVIGPGGTLDDLVLTTEVTGTDRIDDPEKTAFGGDLVTWTLESPNAGLDGQIPVLLGALYPDGPEPSSFALPELYMPVSSIVILFDGGAAGGFFGPVTLTPGGVTIGGPMPVGLGGLNLISQLVVASPAATNGIYATSNPHYLNLNN